MSRRGWIFAGVAVAVALFAVCCVAVIAIFVFSSGDLSSQLGVGSSNKLEYRVVNSGRTEAATRRRWQIDVVVDVQPTTKQWVDTLAQIARDELAKQPDLKAVVVLGYLSDSQFKKAQPQVFAMASSDGQGWSGDGTLLAGDDKGEIEVIIGTQFKDGKLSKYDEYSCEFKTKTCTKVP